MKKAEKSLIEKWEDDITKCPSCKAKNIPLLTIEENVYKLTCNICGFISFFDKPK